MTTLWEVWLTCWYATTCYTNSQCTIALYMKLKSYAYQIIKVPPTKWWLMGCHKSRHSKTWNQHCQWTTLRSHLYCAWNNSCTKEPGAGSGEPSGGFSSCCIEGWRNNKEAKTYMLYIYNWLNWSIVKRWVEIFLFNKHCLHWQNATLRRNVFYMSQVKCFKMCVLNLILLVNKVHNFDDFINPSYQVCV